MVQATELGEFDDVPTTTTQQATPRGASAVHDVLVQICTQWGMQGTYLQLKQFLESQYPELTNHIRVETYPIPPAAQLLQQALAMFQLFVMAALLMGESIFSYIPFFGGRVPDWYYSMKQNPAMVIIGLFLMAPTIIQSYIQTNAFEIILDGNLVFSRLETGRMPNGEDITTAFLKAGLKAVTSSQ